MYLYENPLSKLFIKLNYLLKIKLLNITHFINFSRFLYLLSFDNS